jgi:type IV pilus assembly protein PilX
MMRANLFKTSRRSRQGGFVLIMALLFLLVLTVLSVTMFKSFGILERIAGNTRDKQRAFEASQSGLEYGEWWLSQGNGSFGTVCANTGPANGNDLTKMKVCADGLPKPLSLPWPDRIDYKPPYMIVASGGGLANGGGGDVNYSAMPSLYITYLGPSPDNNKYLFSVAGAGYGGNADTASVVQSTYALDVKNAVKDLSTP